MRPERYVPSGVVPPSAGGSGGRAALLLAVALALGIALLQGFEGDPYARRAGASSPTTAGTPETTRPRSSATTSTTRALRPPAEVKVLPLNGSGVTGAATRAATVLKEAGYNTLAPDNARRVNRSTVEFAPGFEGEAGAVARVLSLSPSDVQPLSSPPPIADIRGAGVVVVVGPDLAASLPAGGTTTTSRRAAATTTRRTTATTSTATTARATTITTGAPATTTTL